MYSYTKDSTNNTRSNEFLKEKSLNYRCKGIES